MDENYADDLAKQMLDLKRDNTVLIDTYYKKMAKEISPIVAIRFVQVDDQFGTLINLLRVRSVPLMKTPEEVATQFGLQMSSPISDDAGAEMDARVEDNIDAKIKEERTRKGL